MRTAIDHGLVVHKEQVNSKNVTDNGLRLCLKVCDSASKGKQFEITVLRRCGAYGNVSGLGDAGWQMERSFLFLLSTLLVLQIYLVGEGDRVQVARVCRLCTDSICPDGP